MRFAGLPDLVAFRVPLLAAQRGKQHATRQADKLTH